MPRFRTIALVLSLCLLLFGCLAAPAMAAQISQPGGDTVAKFLPTSLGLAASLSSLMQQQTIYVYTTRTGACYHRHYCVAHHVHFRRTLSWAKSHGLRPCRVCKPPR